MVTSFYWSPDDQVLDPETRPALRLHLIPEPDGRRCERPVCSQRRTNRLLTCKKSPHRRGRTCWIQVILWALNPAHVWCLTGAWNFGSEESDWTWCGISSSFLREASGDLTGALKGVGWIQPLHLTVGIHADTKCCSGNILNGLLWIWENPFYAIFPGCSRWWSVDGRWRRSSLPPSTQSYAKGLLQYYDSIITISGEYADFQKHTSLLSLSSQRENTYWALGWT